LFTERERRESERERVRERERERDYLLLLSQHTKSITTVASAKGRKQCCELYTSSIKEASLWLASSS
jgi:hypothetical protein